jgi:hypothetical protein
MRAFNYLSPRRATIVWSLNICSSETPRMSTGRLRISSPAIETNPELPPCSSSPWTNDSACSRHRRAVRHAVLHFEVRRGEFVPLIKLSPVCRDSLFQRGVQKKRSSPEGSEIQRKPLEMRWRPECYSEASSAAFISLFLISITSLYIERETGIEPRDVQLGKMDSDAK